MNWLIFFLIVIIFSAAGFAWLYFAGWLNDTVSEALVWPFVTAANFVLGRKSTKSARQTHQFVTTVPAGRIIDAVVQRWGPPRSAPQGPAETYVADISAGSVTLRNGNHVNPHFVGAHIEFASQNPAAGTISVIEGDSFVDEDVDIYLKMRADFTELVRSLAPDSFIGERKADQPAQFTGTSPAYHHPAQQQPLTSPPGWAHPPADRDAELARHPRTEPGELRRLARDRPDLWPSLAAHPNADAELLAWFHNANISSAYPVNPNPPTIYPLDSPWSREVSLRPGMPPQPSPAEPQSPIAPRQHIAEPYPQDAPVIYPPPQHTPSPPYRPPYSWAATQQPGSWTSPQQTWQPRSGPGTSPPSPGRPPTHSQMRFPWKLGALITVVALTVLGIGAWAFTSLKPKSVYGPVDFAAWEVFGPVQADVESDGRGVRLSSSTHDEIGAGLRYPGVEVCAARISGRVRLTSYAEGQRGGFAIGIGTAPMYGDGQRRAHYSAGVGIDFAESVYRVPLFEDPVPDVAGGALDDQWHDVALEVDAAGQQSFSVDGREIFTHQLTTAWCGDLTITVWSGAVDLLYFHVDPVPGSDGGSVPGEGSSDGDPHSLVGIWSSSDGTADKTFADDGLCDGFYYSHGEPLDIGGPMFCQLSTQPDSAGRYKLIVSQSPNRSTYLVEFHGGDSASVYTTTGSLLYELTRS
ncbi:hypothetical protein ORI20_32540 [Mycobacterium sp. CVI_P3]|uniref:Leucine rich repeat variant domain-containing protein n=1 Tax=Mycobacterium pinniadriaticum TaxID=2994102 RepID=A0ABT3SPF5_9MYCO|nr:hypothetical protein [Mycobacterium pinniadriaticum]MCX2934992.1 hypothetical protein [Mycobacterium pinniadriaticum]MCX2941414.1 hypothetical protein [Mycobacterium pinniadriaticum]